MGELGSKEYQGLQSCRIRLWTNNPPCYLYNDVFDWSQSSWHQYCLDRCLWDLAFPPFPLVQSCWLTVHRFQECLVMLYYVRILTTSLEASFYQISFLYRQICSRLWDVYNVCLIVNVPSFVKSRKQNQFHFIQYNILFIFRLRNIVLRGFY